MPSIYERTMDDYEQVFNTMSDSFIANVRGITVKGTADVVRVTDMPDTFGELTEQTKAIVLAVLADLITEGFIELTEQSVRSTKGELVEAVEVEPLSLPFGDD